jgi:hypothetical protein
MADIQGPDALAAGALRGANVQGVVDGAADPSTLRAQARGGKIVAGLQGNRLEMRQPLLLGDLNGARRRNARRERRRRQHGICLRDGMSAKHGCDGPLLPQWRQAREVVGVPGNGRGDQNVIAWRGPQRGCPPQRAPLRVGDPGLRRASRLRAGWAGDPSPPQPSRRVAGGRAASLAGGGPPCGISRPLRARFAPRANCAAPAN